MINRIFTLILALNLSIQAEVYMANGMKIGEVDANSAIIWTRLTQAPERNTNGKKFKSYTKAEEQPNYPNLTDMEASVSGTSGEIQISYWPKGTPEKTITTAFKKATEQTDYTHQFQLENLLPETNYSLIVHGRNNESTCKTHGKFRTAPAADTQKDIRFVVTTCGDYPRRDDRKNGHKIYVEMLKLNPDFFVHTGDIEYYDKPAPYATNPELARLKWNRIFSMPFIRDFHNNVSSYFMKDDHDTVKNDAWPSQNYFDISWEEGLAIFLEQVPMGEKTYRTVRWGKDLQIWLVEGRDFRSPNTLPDSPEKTIWGKEQKQWFFETVEASDATFKILLSPTPIVGPDRLRKNDNHANEGFKHEGDQLRKFIADQKNMYIICGDRHWQYASIDPKTGVREFSCGPASDRHAQGYSEKQRNDMHRYLQIIGGFLQVEVEHIDSTPKLIFKHHSVDGEIQNQEIFTPQP